MPPTQFILAALCGACLASCSEPAVADVGIYAYRPEAWNSDVARDFPIVVVQYRSWKRDPEAVRQIRDLARQGSRVIIDFKFVKSREGKADRVPMPPLGDIMGDAEFFFRGVGDVPLEGITLDEESAPTARRLAGLANLYNVLKARYPDRIFLQWIAADADPAKLDLAGIPADGWVFDPYLLPPADYTAYVAEMRGVTDRLYSVVWASPDWQVGGGFRAKADGRWWNEERWRILYNRLAVNQANDIPSIFFLFGLEGEKEVPLWQGDACQRAFYRDFTDKLLPYIAKHRLPRAIPAERPNWMPVYC